jgi:hypothetical protein
MLRLVSPEAEGFSDLDEEFYEYEDDLYSLVNIYESTFGN